MSQHERAAGLRRPILVALGTTACVTLLSYVLPESLVATGIGLAFLAITYGVAMQNDAAIRAHGLDLAGLMTGERLSARRIARDAGQALAWALGLSALIFPIFWLGYVVWYEPQAQFVPARVPALFDDVMGQLFVIALPEEAFYRGYLQTELDQRLPAGRRKILGVELGLGWLLASLIFALGHLLTDLHPSRLAVFFPGLLFGWLRVKTRGIGSAVVFHAACNLFATYLGRSYGLLR